ncbi:MAG: MOSC domain-containing protein [Dehalococcoidia bacterium]|nr:MOSC domain-containing protein [Dehalococcoidia bacterium]
MAIIIAVCLSSTKGTSKIPVEQGIVKTGFGLEGDAHAGGAEIRQISLLALESIEKMNAGGFSFRPGDFAENLTTHGIDLVSLPIGTRLMIGNSTILETTQIGKKCHKGCDVYKQAGYCIMPREGVFARVIKGGTVRSNDLITVM